MDADAVELIRTHETERLLGGGVRCENGSGF
jgi:hypothetical protein